MVRKPTDTVQLKVRLSEALRREMEDAAARRGRSMNAEIVARLQSSVVKDQDAMTELAKMVLDSVSDEVRQKMIELIAQTAMEASPYKEKISPYNLRKEERKAVGKGKP